MPASSTNVPASDPPDQAHDQTALSSAEVRSRTTNAIVAFAVRGAGIRLAGLLGYLAFARLLDPSDLGVAAFALGFAFFAQFFADFGFSGAMIRAPTEPSQGQLRALAGLQLLVVSVILLPILAWEAVASSAASTLALLYVAALVPVALRSPSTVVLERKLRFGKLVFAEIVEVILFYMIAVGLLLAGSGVVSLGVATLVKAIVGSAIVVRASGIGLTRPSFKLSPLRPHLSFGLTAQAHGAVPLARDQLLNVGVLALASTATLGIWTITGRILSLPMFAFEALWRVAFPAVARMTEAGEDVARHLVRGGRLLALVVSLALVPVAAAAPYAVDVVLGEKWSDAAPLIPVLCLGSLISIPVSVVATSALYAGNRPRDALMATSALSASMVVIGLALVPWLGAFGIAVGSLTGSTLDALLLSRSLERLNGARVLRAVMPPIPLAVAASAGGYAASTAAGSTLASLVVGGGCGTVLLLLLLTAFLRADLRDLIQLARRSVQKNAVQPEVR